MLKNNGNNFVVVCVVGQPGSGKDTLANFLEKKKNFSHISTGNIIREEMKKKNISIDRENMRIFSQNRRRETGNSYPANIAVGKIVGNTVISGPRNAEEILVFKDKFGENFILVAVDAPIKVRYERIKNGRGRTGDNISFNEFNAQEEAELSSKTHGLNELLLAADYVIDNSGTEEKMFAEMNRILGKVKKMDSCHF